VNTSLKLAAALVAALAGAAHAERWQMQYFFDENKRSLQINDLVFPTAQRGVAVGFLNERDNVRGTAVVTSDGGAHWALVPLPDPALSVFFLNDSTGWVVTTRNILRTDEGGRSWRKLPKSPKEAWRVWFTDPERGWAVGARKSAWQTADGGKTWTRLAAAAELKTSEEHTVLSSIAFTGRVGMITGWSRRPRYDDTELPDWMEPEQAARRREWPAVSVSIETHDGGQNWKGSTISVLGEISRVRMSPDGRALALIRFRNAFDYPSEVYAIQWKNGSSRQVYRDKSRDVTDAALAADGPAFLAAIEVPGRMLRAPVPARLHMLTSTDMKLWREMEVDYRATAQRAVLAVADAANAWVATDTGMILKLLR
jgi:photosystem II stability/assembly factor-like uncharacterized protein